ncbi:MAG: DegT/DnrJ/EryC1/StrS family aminotransferase [Deltaproteobacteria bacterium]|nr:DegT/DnrJ/EryC1/StrS family aminotransferase [Deltaproteobacteria bacterium]
MASPPGRKRIYLSVPHMGGNEERYVQEAFRTNWLSTVGPNLEQFERDFSARMDTPCVALASGTAAMHLGLRLLGVGPGDTVLCPSLTFVASVNPIGYLGARPIFIDSDRTSWNLDPALLAETLTQRARAGTLPKALVVVHLYGQSADMDPILEVCAEHGVGVLEDAAEALGTLYKGRPAGTLAPLGVFSFNGNKIITTTSGGMLIGHDPAMIERARYWSQQAREPAVEYHHVDVGYNYRMSNVLAGIGRGQLEVLDERVQQRRSVAFRYRDAFARYEGISLMPQAAYGLNTNWLSCFLIDEGVLGISRDALIAALSAEDIESRPVWKPMHLQPLYEGCERHGGDVAEDLYLRGICLPSSSSLTESEQQRVVDVMCAAIDARRTR